MKKKCLLLFFLFVNAIYSQNPKLTFTYDTAGNQTSRVYCATCSTVSGKNSVNYNELKENDLKQFIPNDIISYYPNPVKEELYLKWKLKENNTMNQMQIFNSNGGLIRSIENLSNKENLVVNFSDLPQGMYLLELIYSDDSKESIKIIKN